MKPGSQQKKAERNNAEPAITHFVLLAARRPFP